MSRRHPADSALETERAGFRGASLALRGRSLLVNTSELPLVCTVPSPSLAMKSVHTAHKYHNLVPDVCARISTNEQRVAVLSANSSPLIVHNIIFSIM